MKQIEDEDDDEEESEFKEFGIYFDSWNAGDGTTRM